MTYEELEMSAEGHLPSEQLTDLAKRSLSDDLEQLESVDGESLVLQ